MTVEQNTVELTSSNKYIKHSCTWNNSHRILTEQGQKISHIQSCKSDHHVTGKDERGKKKKGNRERTWAPGRDLWKKKGSFTLGTAFNRLARTDRALRRLREKCSRWLVAGRTKKGQHRWSWPPHCTTRPKMGVFCWCAQGLGAETRLQWTALGKGLGLAAQTQSAAWPRPQTGVCKGRRLAGYRSRTAASLSFSGTHSRCSSASKSSGSVQVPVGGPHVEVGLKSEPCPSVFGGFRCWRLCKLSALRTSEGITGTPVGVQVWH